LSELNLGRTTTIAFPEGREKLLAFEVTIRPDEGFHKGGSFTFSFVVAPTYPHEAPKVKCKTKVRAARLAGCAAVLALPPHSPPAPASASPAPHLRQVYHPNIDLEGNVCLNILREARLARTFRFRR